MNMRLSESKNVIRIANPDKPKTLNSCAQIATVFLLYLSMILPVNGNKNKATTGPITWEIPNESADSVAFKIRSPIMNENIALPKFPVTVLNNTLMLCFFDSVKFIRSTSFSIVNNLLVVFMYSY